MHVPGRLLICKHNQPKMCWLFASSIYHTCVAFDVLSRGRFHFLDSSLLAGDIAAWDHSCHMMRLIHVTHTCDDKPLQNSVIDLPQALPVRSETFLQTHYGCIHTLATGAMEDDDVAVAGAVADLYENLTAVSSYVFMLVESYEREGNCIFRPSFAFISVNLKTEKFNRRFRMSRDSLLLPCRAQ